MFNSKRTNFATGLAPRLMVLATLSALAACGGGDDPSPPVTSPQPTVPLAPGTPPPPTTPTTPGTPATPPTPPTDPVTPPSDTTPVTLAAAFTDLGVAANTSTPNWGAWTGTGKAVDGVGCLINEDYHIHTLLSIYRDGTRLALPDAIGRSGCAYELHTHDASGVIHIETNVPKKFTLGQFFALWRQPLTATGIAGLAGPYRIYLIEAGKLTPFTGDPATIELKAYREIVILTGTKPPSVLPKYKWIPGL